VLTILVGHQQRTLAGHFDSAHRWMIERKPGVAAHPA
jgi:hypothetical protein